MDRSLDDTPLLMRRFETGITTREAKARVFFYDVIEAKACTVVNNMRISLAEFKPSSLSEVAQWVNDAWYRLPADILRAAFFMCGISVSAAPLLTANSSNGSQNGNDCDCCILLSSDDKS